MGLNSQLKTLTLDGSCSMEDFLCTAMQYGLGMHSRLEHLNILQVRMRDDTAHTGLSFLRTNHALKSLNIALDERVKPSRVAAFRIKISAMRQENTSLESLSIPSFEAIEHGEYTALVTALRHNRTLKRLSFVTHYFYF